jgi:hypothetical protein
MFTMEIVCKLMDEFPHLRKNHAMASRTLPIRAQEVER